MVFYFASVPSSNARVVGRMVGNLIKFAAQQTGLNFNSVHCIGFSVGGHLCSFLAKWMDEKIGRITGSLKIKFLIFIIYFFICSRFRSSRSNF